MLIHFRSHEALPLGRYKLREFHCETRGIEIGHKTDRRNAEEVITIMRAQQPCNENSFIYSIS